MSRATHFDDAIAWRHCWRRWEFSSYRKRSYCKLSRVHGREFSLTFHSQNYFWISEVLLKGEWGSLSERIIQIRRPCSRKREKRDAHWLAQGQFWWKTGTGPSHITHLYTLWAVLRKLRRHKLSQGEIQIWWLSLHMYPNIGTDKKPTFSVF